MAFHVAQFYPCSKVSLACELYYICELGKYSFINYNEPLSIDGVILDSVLKKSKIWHYFRMCVDQGWVTNTGVSAEELTINSQYPLDYDKGVVCNYLFGLDEVPFDAEDNLKRNSDYNYAMRTPVKSRISFEEMTDTYWLWSINGFENNNFITNNKSLNHARADQAWLSLIAMVAVERIHKGSPQMLLLNICNQVILNDMALSYLMILTEETSCINEWVKFCLDESVSKQTALHLGYTAWYRKGKDIGLLDRWYSPAEKLDYMKKLDIIEGDIVTFYEREKTQRNNFVKSIASCHMAKVVKITDKSITFELINTVKPYFQGKEDFDNHTIAVKRMYHQSLPYETLKTSKQTIDMADMGVEYLLHNERVFIVPLDGTDDVRTVRVSDGVRKDTLNLDQNNLLYWILKDYKYEFNEERFLAKYFANEEPVYTRYMRGETLEAEYYYTPE